MERFKCSIFIRDARRRETVLRRVLLAMLSYTVIVGLAISEDPIETKSEGIQFNYEDSTSGSGNFASYNKMVMQGPHSDARVLSRLADVHLQKANHGSGSIERESIIKSTESIETQNDFDTDSIYAYALIAVLDNNSMVYSPQTMAIGSGYYSANPVNFRSLLGDMAQIKNYASKTSISHEIDYAHAINMDQVASVEDDYYDADNAKSLTRSLMDLNGAITSGTAHLKVLQGSSRRSKIAWSNAPIDVDQIYTGTFEFATKMNLTVPVYKSQSGEPWLPCCFSGWGDMEYYDLKAFGSSAKRIFDCTCPNVPAKED